MSSAAPLEPTEFMQHIGNEEDEIDLNKLFFKLWKRRLFIFAFVLIAIILISGINAIIYIKTSTVENFAITVRFNFPSVKTDQYPSGQLFSKSDLISSAILKKVYEINDIKKHNITFDNFSSGFSVTPYSLNSKTIHLKYEKLLSDTKLSAIDIETLGKKQLKELQIAQNNFAKISYLDTLTLDLSPIIIEKVLNDIPKVWSEIAIQKLGVLDFKINSQQFYETKLVENVEYLNGVQYMQDSSKRFKAILLALQKDDIGGFVRDPESGFVVSDVLARLHSIVQYDLPPIYSIITNIGLVKNKQKAQLFLSNQIELLGFTIAELKRKAEVYQEAQLMYNSQGKNRLQNNNLPEQNTRKDVVQYGDKFLSEIVNMVEGNQDVKYRQSLSAKQIELKIKLHELSTKLEKNKQAFNVLKLNKQPNSNLLTGYIDKIKTINEKLINLITIYKRILNARNSYLLGKSSVLYEKTSVDLLRTTDNPLNKKKLLLYTIAFAFIALMLAVFIALITKEKEKYIK